MSEENVKKTKATTAASAEKETKPAAKKPTATVKTTVEKKVTTKTKTAEKETEVKTKSKTATKTEVKPAEKSTEKKAVKTEKTTAASTKVATSTKAADKKVATTSAPKAKKTAAKTAKVKVQEFIGTGKRKCSVARVRMTTGSGQIVVNGVSLEEYFGLDTLMFIVKQPLTLTETDKSVDIIANIYGGGKAGQAGALRHGITRALIAYRPELRPELKKAGFVTRDARKKERKKYGLKKARRAPQFSKR